MVAKVFVSHSGADRDVAIFMHDQLVSRGHRVFVDIDRIDGIQGGEEWENRLYAELRAADVIVCLVSQSYITSQWCGYEIATAKALGVRPLPISLQRGHLHPLLSALQHHDYGNDPNAAAVWLDAAIRGTPPAALGGWADHANPYPGLRPFDTGWQQVFFGRDHDRQVIASMLRSPATQGLIIVVGPSGCGKSSLVRAGVMPHMATHEDWYVLPPVLPGTTPVEALATELAAQGVQLGLGWSLEHVRQALTDTAGLADLAAQILIQASTTGHRRHLLIVIDQFEEILLADVEQQARLAGLLASAIAGPVSVVVTIRPEFLSRLLETPEFDPLLSRRHAVTLGPLAVDALAEVITGPARRAGITVDEQLVGRMVADTGTGEALPLLALGIFI